MIKTNKIVLEAPKVIDDNKIHCHFRCSEEISKYFNDYTFCMEVNEDVNSVPMSILIIPALSNICPIAWFTEADIYVDEMDQDFYEALNTIKGSFQKMYPKFSFKSTLHYNQLNKNKGYDDQKSGLFFSGGVDSLTSYVRKRHERPYLLSVWGADIPLSESEGWNRVQNDIKEFSTNHQLEPLFIKSNLKSFLNYKKLKAILSKQWWGSIQHALGLIGLSAPLAFIKGMNTIYLGSTDNPLSLPWGSHPSIDNNVKWGETQAISEGMELLRLDKLKVLAEYIKNVDPTIQIRVCWVKENGMNCNECEKCSRTIAGLMTVGLNPNDHGFNMNRDTLVNFFNDYKEKYFHTLSDARYLEWISMKSYLANNHSFNPEYSDFYQWVLESDFTR